jgi:hypothetical protein
MAYLPEEGNGVSGEVQPGIQGAAGGLLLTHALGSQVLV